MDEELNIRVTVSGETTLGEIKQRVKEINKELLGLGLTAPQAKILRQEMTQLKSAMDQAAGGTGALMRSYFKLGEEGRRYQSLIRQERMEQRQTNFAINEGIGVVEAFTGKSKILSDVVGGSVNSFSGVSFAVKAMGENFIKYATPLAAAAAGFFAVNKLLEMQEALTNNLIEAQKKHIELLHDLGKLSDEQYKKQLQRQLDIAKLEAKGGTTGFWPLLGANLIGGQAGMMKQIAADMITAENKVLEIEKLIKAVDENITKEKEKQLKAVKTAAEKEAERYEKEFVRTGGLQVNLSNVAPVGRPRLSILSQPLTFDSKQASSLAIAAAQFKAELNDTSTVIDQFKGAMYDTTNILADSFVGLIKGTMNLSQTFSYFTQSIINMILQMAAQRAAEGIVGTVLGAVGLSTQSAPMQPMASINQMGQAGRFGSGSSGTHAYVEVVPIIEADRLSVMVKYGDQIRKRRIL